MKSKRTISDCRSLERWFRRYSYFRKSLSALSMFVSITCFKIGFFSAIIAAFIIEFYKQLSPDSGNQTVAFLGQILRKLVILPNGTYSITANQPSPPSAFMI